MMARIAQAGLLALFVLSLAMTGLAAKRIADDPLLRPIVDASLAEITAASDRMMAREATVARISDRMNELLAESPRNWLAIQAVEGVAAERGITLPADLTARRNQLWEDESGIIAAAGACMSCVWDAGTCSLTTAMVCNAPITLSPIGDVAGVARAGANWVADEAVDQIDLALSIIGLGASATVVVSGGSSLTLKAGAGVVRMARKLRLATPALNRLLGDVVAHGIDWRLVRGLDFSDPARLIRADVVAPLASIASDMGRIGARLPATETLHLLRYVDNADDARRLATLSEALGPRTLGRIEVLGKARFLRATVRVSNLALQTVTGLIGLILSIATLVASAVQSTVLRSVRHAFQRQAAK